MKFKMKLQKKHWIIGGTAIAAVLLTVILCIALIPNRTPQTPTETEPNTESSVKVPDISIEEPEKTDDTTAEMTTDAENSDGDVTAEKLPDGANVLTPDENTGNSNDSEQTGQKAETADQPVTPKPLPDESGSSGGVVIGGGSQPEPYNCGVAGHHCEAPETHAYILNLELEGCDYCGSHNCPSFYGTDEWGNAGLFPKLCPKYDIHKDAAYYCQDCGKKCGSGSPDLCVQFVNSDNCPICGQWVEAWTCHSCK